MDRTGTLTPQERQLHHALLRGFPHFGGPPPTVWLAEQAAAAGLSPERALGQLAAKEVLQLDPASGAIVAAYPFSGLPTAHRVRINGGEPLWAMCAIDALGIPFMLGEDAEVESRDPITGEPIRITVRAGEATWEPATACVVVGCAEGDGPVSQTLCPTVNFFASPASAEVYAAAHPEVDGQILNQESALRSGVASFGLLLQDEGGGACAEPCCSTTH
jgi:hypothetical protein